MEVISKTNPKAKKEHKCDWCGGIIRIKELYDRSFLKNDGAIYVWKNHTRCAEIASKLKKFDDCCCDGLGEEDFREYIKDEFGELNNDAELPDFLEQLDFVCKYHLTNE